MRSVHAAEERFNSVDRHAGLLALHMGSGVTQMLDRAAGEGATRTGKKEGSKAVGVGL